VALYPKAVQKLIRPGDSDPAIKVVGAILHVDAGNSESLYNYFNGPSGGIESHFHIRKDGTVEQYRDTGFEADANYKANSFYKDGGRQGFVSIETQGYGAGEWTPEQLGAIRSLLTWLATVHQFPLKKTTSSTGPGVGYHTLYPGVWTPYAKSCPGPDRIKQFEELLVPWMNSTSRPKVSDVEHVQKSLNAARKAARIARKNQRAGRWRRLRRVIRILKALGGK
jgi:N-acetyl-anhydromuramyl-L-alanine amidase AmpD